MREARRKIAEGALKVYADGTRRSRARRPRSGRDPRRRDADGAPPRTPLHSRGLEAIGTGRGFDSARAGRADRRTLAARTTRAADPPHLVAVGEQHEAVALHDLVLEALDPGLEELDHAPALVADQVVVVVPRAQALVAIARLADPHPADDPGVDQELERPVDRGPGDLRVLRAQPHEQLVGSRCSWRRRSRRTAPAARRSASGPAVPGTCGRSQLALFHGSPSGLRLCLNWGILPSPRLEVKRGADGGAPTMWQGFTIALREGIEAFLIVALTLSYLNRTGRGAPRPRGVRRLGVSVLTCSARGLALLEGREPVALGGNPRARRRGPRRQPARLHEARFGRLKARHREPHRGQRRLGATARGRFWGVFVFTLLMITREGMETALLIATAFFQMKSSAVLLGLALGLVGRRRDRLRCGRGSAAASTLKTLLNISAVFLAIFLVQLVLYGIHELSEARVFPSSQAIHDATEILGPDGKIGHLLAYALARRPDGVARRALVEAAQRARRTASATINAA